ncbi:hypothetical protein BOVMAS18_18860 [Streptococcus uberis]
MIGDLYKDNETGDIYHVWCHGKLDHDLKPVVIYQDLDDEVWVMPIAVILVSVVNIIQTSQIKELKQLLNEQRQEFVDREKAIRQELADLKRYIQTGEASGG